MKTSRRWSEWPKRIGNSLNGTSGVSGAGGLIISAAGAAVFTGAAATVLATSGFVIAGAAVCYSILSSVPPKLQNPANLVGMTIETSKLEGLWPPVLKIAIVGPSRVGKTTLKNRLHFANNEPLRTQSVSATVIAIPTTPISYLAVLDGGGEKLAQQFRIAELADFLCIVVDHNISDNDPAISNQRKNETSQFLEQIRGHLHETSSLPKKWIEILVNKRDLWSTIPEVKQKRFIANLEKELQKWKDGNFSKDVSIHPHSNENADDVSRFMNILKSSLAK